MKRSQFVSSSRRKSRKAHFGAPSHERRKHMAAPLSKELRQKFGVRSMPIRKDDEVVIRRGGHKSNDPQKVVTVRRRKFVIHLAGLNTEKSNGSSVAVGVHPSNVEIVKLKLDKDRKRAIDRKSKFRFTQADKNKVQQQDIPVQ